jgi:hypothetical protein
MVSQIAKQENLHAFKNSMAVLLKCLHHSQHVIFQKPLRIERRQK